MNTSRPSFAKILWVDYWALLSALVGVLSAGFYIYNSFLSAKPAVNMDLFVLAGFFIGVLGVMLRYASIASLIGGGLELTATVSEVGFFRDRGIIKYIFTHEGKRMSGHTSVMKTKATTRYQPGQEVTIVVDRENPKKTLLKDLFV